MGPLLCFIIVPLIGRASDRCKSKYGRRRPFIFCISTIILLSLVFIPVGENLSRLFVNQMGSFKHAGVSFLTIGVIFLDFSTQALLTPCEALLSDASRDTDQKERIFTIYSFMISFGGCVGYLITALDWSNTSIGIYFGGQEQAIFAILTILYLLASAATLMVAEESPLQQNNLEQVPLYSDVEEMQLVISNVHESGYETSSNESVSDDNVTPSIPYLKNHNRISPSKSIKVSPIHTSKTLPFIFRIPFLLCKLPIIYYICKYLKQIFRSLWTGIYHRLPETVQTVLDVPLVLRQLAAANFCSWTALMGFTLFYTDYVGQAVYQGNPNAPENSLSRNNFDEGVRMGSWGLLFHCMTSAAYSPFIERLVARFGCRLTYLVGMASFSLAMFVMVLCHNIVIVNAIAAITGFGYATMTTIPFILISDYHADKEIFFFDVEPTSSSSSSNSQVRGIATDMAILDSTYFLSQVILSGIMGYIVHITGTVLSYIITAGVMGIFSCIFTTKIIINKQDILQYVRVSRTRTIL